MSVFSDMFNASYESTDLITRLEHQLERLHQDEHNVALLSSVISVFRSHQESLSQRGFFSSVCHKTLEYFHLDDTTLRINALYAKTLSHHGLMTCGDRIEIQNLESLIKEDKIDIVLHMSANNLDLRSQAVLIATTLGHTQGVEALLANNAPIDPSRRTSAIHHAVEHGHVDILRSLLENALIDPKDRVSAIHRAIEHGHMDILCVLLENEKTIPQQYRVRGRIVVDATIRSNANMIENLLKDSSDITEQERGEALLAAVQYQNEAILDILLANGPISSNDMTQAVIYAWESNHEKMTLSLLEKGPISAYGRQIILEEAVKKGQLKIIQALLKNRLVSQSSFEQAVKIAWKLGHQEIFTALASSTDFSCQSRGWVALQAIENGDTELTRSLLENGAISKEAAIEVLKWALRFQANLEMVKILLVNDPIGLARDLILDNILMLSLDDSKVKGLYQLILENSPPEIPKEFLHQLDDCRNPYVKDYLMRIFVKKTTEEIVSLLKQINHERFKDYHLILFIIDAFNLDPAKKSELFHAITALHNKCFHDFIKRNVMLNTLYHLEKTPDLHHVRLLLKLLDKSIPKKELWLTLLNFSSILANSPSLLSEITEANLSSRELSELIIGDLKDHHLIDKSFDSMKAMEIFSSLRNPGALFTYLSNCKDNPKLKPALQLFIAGLLERTFEADRNERNSHKAYLTEEQLALWQSAHRVEGILIEDSDYAEDLLLCGTELAGSCQSVHSDTKWSKCLMGYVIDGKVRILAEKTSEGIIKARAIIKIMLNENGQPALFLEKAYGGDDQSRKDIKALAISKARAMGVPLFELYQRAQDSEAQPELFKLTSEGNAAPYEYEDGLGTEGITKGVYTIQAMKIT